MAAGYNTWQDSTTRPEDVVDLVKNISFATTPFISMIGDTTAQNTLHEWLRDSYAGSADNATGEGSDATVVDDAAPQRPNNIVQLFRKTVTVSDTQRAIAHYGTGDPFTYFTNKKLKELGKDMEKAAIAGTRASGNSGVARRMDGAIALISTNKSAQTSGTSLTVTVMNNILAGVYTNGTDEDVTDVFVGAYLKVAISGFTDGVTKYLDAEKGNYVRRVSVFESDFGTLAYHLEREVPAGGVLGVNIDEWKLAWLTGRRAQMTPLGKTGSSTKGLIEGEATLEALAEQSSFYYSGYFVG